jgi:hypothetical protein
MANGLIIPAGIAFVVFYFCLYLMIKKKPDLIKLILKKMSSNLSRRSLIKGIIAAVQEFKVFRLIILKMPFKTESKS